MSAKYQAMTIANWFVAWAEDEQADISNLKLQKLLYYAQGWHLAQRGEALFGDKIKAWSHGPVVPVVYHAFKRFGSGDIELEEDNRFSWDEVDPDTSQLLIKVWNSYGQFGAWRLRLMTHDEAPWRDNFRTADESAEIPLEDIRRYFVAQK